MSRAQSTLSRSEVSDELVHPGRKLTEREFVDWVGDGWAEWVNGEVILMSPVNFEHADLHTFLVMLVGGWANEHDLGTVLTEPFQIRFALEKSRRSPDIIFVSRRRMSMMKTQHFEGPPDLIFEIISPDSQSRDRREKFLEYEKAGVREYWIVDPLSKKLEGYRFGRDGKYALLQAKDGKLVSRVLSGFYIRSEWLWRAKFPKVSALLREMSAKR
jgi:Uma2 family endonuclease